MTCEYEAAMVQVIKKCHEVMDKANSLYGIDLKSKVDIRFDLTGSYAGFAGINKGQIYLRFNVDMLVGKSFNFILNDTVPHEIAHLMCFINPKLGGNHDRGWKSVCINLGGNGQRCHTEPVLASKTQTKFVYTSTNGLKVPVTAKVHDRIQLNSEVYIVNKGGRLDKTCTWVKKVIEAGEERVW
jgi:predicted SprT family Zn-dependent metalloprotease